MIVHRDSSKNQNLSDVYQLAHATKVIKSKSFYVSNIKNFQHVHASLKFVQ